MSISAIRRRIGYWILGPDAPCAALTSRIEKALNGGALDAWSDGYRVKCVDVYVTSFGEFRLEFHREEG